MGWYFATLSRFKRDFYLSFSYNIKKKKFQKLVPKIRSVVAKKYDIIFVCMSENIKYTSLMNV